MAEIITQCSSVNVQTIGVETGREELKDPRQRRGAGSSILRHVTLQSLPLQSIRPSSRLKLFLKSSPRNQPREAFREEEAGRELKESQRCVRLTPHPRCAGVEVRRENYPAASWFLAAADPAVGLPFRHSAPASFPGAQTA